MAADTTAKLFSDKSDIYAKARPTYPPEVFEFLAKRAPAHNRVWDCATGNGQAAQGLARHFDEVYATDISAEQIDNHLDIAGVDFTICPAENTPFADQSFDMVNVAQALHWFDLDKFWPEVRRVLKPGGLFACISYDWFCATPEIDACVERYAKAVVQPYWAANNQMVIDHYQQVKFPFEKLPAPELYIRSRWNLHNMIDYIHTWSAVRKLMKIEGDGFFIRFSNELAKVWGDPERQYIVKSPLTIIAGYAQ